MAVGVTLAIAGFVVGADGVSAALLYLCVAVVIVIGALMLIRSSRR